jgi:hypothetical protein
MGIDIQYLLWLQNLRNSLGGAFDEFFNALSKFAVDVLPFLPFVIFWGVDKSWGYFFLTNHWTGWCFYMDAESIYHRGLLMILLYGLAAFYVVMGFVVGVYAKRATFNNTKREIQSIALGGELLIFALNTVSLFFYSRIIYGAFSLPFITGSFLPRLAIACAKGFVYGLITRPILVKLSKVTHNGH